MFEYFALLLAIPVGLILSKITKRERDIFSKVPYFPVFIWVLAILASIFLSLEKVVGFTLLFIFLIVLVWHHFDV